ncbi:MAG: DUF6194 family protein [Gammaproteobacteria bacterium]
MSISGVSAAEIEKLILEKYAHISPANSWGERAFFVNPNSFLPRGTYFATIKSKDGDNDRASRLHRPGVFRLNIGLPRAEFAKLFPVPFRRPAKGGTVSGNYDFSRRNAVLPHPVYGRMNWIAVLNLDLRLWKKCAPLLDAAYQKSFANVRRRMRGAGDSRDIMHK